jgi:hypothetical protein
MSINSKGQITTYCGVCLNYTPDKTFPIAGLIDQDIGQVYKCRSLVGSKECYGCTNYKDKNKLTDIEKFTIFFLEKLKEHKNIASGLLYGDKDFIDRFEVSTIEKGIVELIKENKIKVIYSYHGPIYSLFEKKHLPNIAIDFDGVVDKEIIKDNDLNIMNFINSSFKVLSKLETFKCVFLNQINIELEKKNTGIIEVIFTYDDSKYKALVDLDDNNKLHSIYYTDKEEQSYFNLDSSNKLYDLIKQILTEVKVKRFSTRLKLLLIASKRKEGEFNKEFVASTLGQEYHPEMTLMDALRHCVAAYQEALEYKQFELSYKEDPLTLLMELLKAPSKKGIQPPLPTDTYSLNEYYNSYINYILQQLRLTNVGWCKKELGFD